MLLGGLASRGSPTGSVVVVGRGMSALPVVVVVSGSLVGSCNISGIVGLVVHKCSSLKKNSMSN